jgi:hypothetical protein
MAAKPAAAIDACLLKGEWRPSGAAACREFGRSFTFGTARVNKIRDSDKGPPGVAKMAKKPERERLGTDGRPEIRS